jgi:hypothetical protein
VSHPKDRTKQRQATVNRRRLVPLLAFTLANRPDHIPVNVIKQELPQVGVQFDAQTALLLYIPKACLIREIPDNGFLPGTLRLDTELRFPERVVLEFRD